MREHVRMNLPAQNLEDEAVGIRLVPFTSEDADDMGRLAEEPGVPENTRIPTQRDEGFGSKWVARYVDGWREGANAGFAIRSIDDGSFLGFVALVRIEKEERQAEAGYVLTEAARGRGAAAAALRLLSEWALDEGLERLELYIDPHNAASIRVAERCGYTREGVLRSLYFKEGRRSDTAVYSLLPTDKRPKSS